MFIVPTLFLHEVLIYPPLPVPFEHHGPRFTKIADMEAKLRGCVACGEVLYFVVCALPFSPPTVGSAKKIKK